MGLLIPSYTCAQSILSTWRGKIVWSTAYSIFVLCGLKFVTQRLKKCVVWCHTRLASMKETARCRDHPSQSFQTPRNEDSQSMKHLSTSDSPEAILSTLRHSREAIWLEHHERGGWNKNWIGSWPDYFSPPYAKKRLGMRLHTHTHIHSHTFTHKQLTWISLVNFRYV